MGYNLINQSQSFRWGANFWLEVLELAKSEGWMPLRTLPPEDWHQDEEWSGNYDWNQGQIVTDKDAKNLGDAVSRAIQKMINKEEVLKRNEKIKLFNNQNGIETLKEFVDFCYLGQFKIE